MCVNNHTLRWKTNLENHTKPCTFLRLEAFGCLGFFWSILLVGLEDMEGQKRVVVVVEESEAANAALGWAVGNFIRPGDIVILLHIHPSSRSRRKMQALRLKGFQLALSFKDRCSAVPEVGVLMCYARFFFCHLCNSWFLSVILCWVGEFPCKLLQVKVEIVVKEGEQVAVISGLVEEIRASALVIGLHEQSCLYRYVCCKFLAY